MNKIKRYAAYASVCVLLLLLGMVGTVLSMDPNRFKPQISEYLSSKMGMPIGLHGPLSWRWGSPIRLHVEQMVIGQDPKGWIRSLKIHHIDLGIEWWPLLHKELRIKTLLIDHPELEFKMSSPSSSSASSSLSAQNIPKKIEEQLTAFQIQQLNIVQAQMRSGTQQWSAVDAQIEALADDHFHIRVSGDYRRNQENKSVPFRAETEWRFKHRFHQWSITALDVTSGIVLKEKSYPWSVHAEGEMNWDDQTLDLSKLHGDIGFFQCDLSAHIKNILHEPTGMANVHAHYQHVPTEVMPPWVQELKGWMPDLFQKGEVIVKYTHEWSHQHVKQCHIRAGNIQAETHLERWVQRSGARWSGRTHIREWIIPQNTHSVANHHQASVWQDSAHKDNVLLSAAMLRWIRENDGDYVLDIDEFYNQDAHLKPIHLQWTWTQGMVHAVHEPIHWNDTEIQTEAWLNAKGVIPQWSIRQRIQKIPSALLLQWLRQHTQKIGLLDHLNLTGTGEVSWDVQADGNTLKELLSHNQGHWSSELTAGVLTGLDANRWVQVGYAVWERRLPPSAKGTPTTPFAKGKADFYLENGIWKTQDVGLRSKDIVLKAEGLIDLLRSWVDLKLWITPTKELELPHPFRVPLLLQGPFSEVSPSLDMKTLMQEQGKAAWVKQQKNWDHLIEQKAKPLAKDLHHSLRDWLNAKEAASD